MRLARSAWAWGESSIGGLTLMANSRLAGREVRALRNVAA